MYKNIRKIISLVQTPSYEEFSKIKYQILYLEVKINKIFIHYKFQRQFMDIKFSIKDIK
jgi:hypothetical protein